MIILRNQWRWVWTGQRRRNSWSPVVLERYRCGSLYFISRNCILFLKWLAKEDPLSPFTGWVMKRNHQRWLVPGAVSPTKATVWGVFSPDLIQGELYLLQPPLALHSYLRGREIVSLWRYTWKLQSSYRWRQDRFSRRISFLPHLATILTGTSYKSGNS